MPWNDSVNILNLFLIVLLKVKLLYYIMDIFYYCEASVLYN
jgi:hypothetical protein